MPPRPQARESYHREIAVITRIMDMIAEDNVLQRKDAAQFHARQLIAILASKDVLHGEAKKAK